MPQAVQRSISLRGPKFYHDGGVLMFVFHYDSMTRDGPRPATHDDMVSYPDALRLADMQPGDPAPETEINNPPMDPTPDQPHPVPLAPEPEPQQQPEQPQPAARSRRS